MNSSRKTKGITICSLVLVCVILVSSRFAKADFVFGPTMNCGPNVNTAAYGEYGASVSADGLTLYFADGALWDWHPSGYGEGDIWMSVRKTLDDEWGQSQNLGPLINTDQSDGCPCISAGGLSLYFASIRPGGSGLQDIYVSKRAAIDAPWENPVNLGPAVNGPAPDVFPSISSDGLTLYFYSLRSGNGDIFVATRTSVDEPFGPAENIGPPINTPDQDEGTPHISSDGKILFFTARWTDTWDIWMSRRTSPDGLWGEPVNLGPPVSTAGGESGPSMTSDGTRFFFHGNRVIPNTVDVWEVEGLPVVDFNGDGKVNGREILIMAARWGLDDPSLDIGPTPFGDGIVDVKDVAALAEHIGKDVHDPTLIAHWPLDETEGIKTREIVSDKDDYALGDAIWEPAEGQVDGALRLDGVDDCVVASFELDPAEGPFSVLAWIKGGAPGQVIISQVMGSNCLMLDAEGRLMTELSSPSRESDPLISESKIDDGRWHRVGLIWDGVQRKLCVDNAVVAEDIQDDLGGSGNGLYIGVEKSMQPGTYFGGMIDDVRIYNRVVRP